jgi:hypothetical protein
VIAWAILVFDDRIKEKRLAGVYLHAEHANIDAVAMQTDGRWVAVEPYELLDAPVIASTDAPRETSAEDFDTPIHVPGEVTSVNPTR